MIRLLGIPLTQLTALIAITALFTLFGQTQRIADRKFPPPPGLDEFLNQVRPKDGFVPNEITAIRIAEAVLVPIYGENEIRSERPFKAILKDGVWTVRGTLPRGSLGGTAVVRLSRTDGRILLVAHEA